MIEHLLQLDQRLFAAVNQGLSNPFFDWLMPLLRNRYLWAPLYLFLAVFFVRSYGKRGFILILFLLITFALTDMFSAGLIKPLAERLRPCNDPYLKAQVIHLVACGPGFSFPSSHAANHAGLAMVLITVFNRKRKWIGPLTLFWVFSICFAQVYVGLHYPADVITGGILGCMIGYVTGTVFITVQPEKRWNPGN